MFRKSGLCQNDHTISFRKCHRIGFSWIDVQAISKGCIIGAGPQAVANGNLAPPAGGLEQRVKVQRQAQLYIIFHVFQVNFRPLGVKKIIKTSIKCLFSET